MWAMIQPSSGGFSQFSDFDLSVYEDFYRDYPNFIGFNYCEQFWGYDRSDRSALGGLDGPHQPLREPAGTVQPGTAATWW